MSVFAPYHPSSASDSSRIYPVFRLLFPNQVIRADDLAHTMVDAAVRDFGAERQTIVLENRDIRALATS